MARDRPVRGTRAVMLPGTGSDQVFLAAAFREPLAVLGIRLDAPEPGVGEAAALDAAAAAPGPLLVGGVSIGAQIAAEWAADRERRLAGLLLALPAWTDSPADAPAARAALASAWALRAAGLDATLEATRARSPRWLADELARAWNGHGAGLADVLLAAARRNGPGLPALRRITAPAGIGGLTDDPLHPLAVARQWQASMPRAELVTTSLAAIGADRASLGRATLLAWLRARSGT